MLVGESPGVARHHNDAVAFQALRLVNRADGFFRRLRPRINPAMGNLREPIVGGIEIAEAGRFPEFLAVDLDIGEVLLLVVSSERRRSILATPQWLGSSTRNRASS